MPSTRASCFASSVLPTPVGPANKKLPVGLSGLPRPERESLIAALSELIALSCPKMTIFRSCSSVCSEALSLVLTFLGGICAILATMASMSRGRTVLRRLSAGTRRVAAPASSMTSIALSGKNRSLMCFADNSAATRKARSVYFTSWCASYRARRPFKIFVVSSTDGSLI